jgi:hypothetical protein
MLDPEAYAEAFKTTIDAALDNDDLNTYALPEADPELPAIILTPGSPFITYRRTFGAQGLAEIRFTAEIRVAVGTDLLGAYSMLYSIAGTGTALSLFDAVGSDNTLGGVVGDCVADGLSQPVIAASADGRPYLYAELGVIINESRS